MVPFFRATIGVRSNGDRKMHTPAITDLDGDGQMEIISASGWVSTGGVYLYARHRDGSIVSGFPIQLPGEDMLIPFRWLVSMVMVKRNCGH